MIPFATITDRRVPIVNFPLFTKGDSPYGIASYVVMMAKAQFDVSSFTYDDVDSAPALVIQFRRKRKHISKGSEPRKIKKKKDISQAFGNISVGFSESLIGDSNPTTTISKSIFVSLPYNINVNSSSSIPLSEAPSLAYMSIPPSLSILEPWKTIPVTIAIPTTIPITISDVISTTFNPLSLLLYHLFQ